MSLPDARTVPAAPRFALGWAAAVYAVLTLLLAYPALAGMFLVNELSDQYIVGYAFREFAAQSLRAGEGFPLWNPYQFGGMPYVAAMHGDIFYPTFLLRMLLPTDVAMTWGFVIHLLLCGLFTFVFLRATGLGFLPSLVGGAAYMMSGPIASYASPGHDGKLFLGALLPLFLWTLHRGVGDGRRWAWGLMALVVGLAVLSPHPQLLQYFLLAGGAYALYVAFGGGDAVNARPPLARGTAFVRLGLSLGAVLLGGLMGAVQFLPVMGYVDWSPRAGGAGWEHAISYSFPPEELLNTYLPQFSGILQSYWGRNGIHFHSEYIGAAVLLLAAAARGRLAGARRAGLWFWGGTLVVSLRWSLGGFTPFYSLVYAIVPGTEFFRAPSTMFYVTTFSVAVLAAIGTRRLLAGAIGRGYVIAWAAFGAVVLALAASGALTNVAISLSPEGREQAALANQGETAVGAVRSLVFLLLAAGLAVAARMGRIPPRVAGWAVVAVVAADLWSIDRRYWRFSPPASEIFATDATIEYLQRLEEPGRVLPLQLGLPQGERREPYMAGLSPYGLRNAGNLMAHRVRSIVGYHGNELGRYQELLGINGDPQVLFAQLANPNVWQLLNVRFLMTDADEPPFQGATRVVGPVRNSAGNTVNLYRMPGDNPLAWVTPVAVKAPDPAVLATLREPAFDIRSAALFDTSAAVQGADVAAPPAPIDLPVEVLAYAPGEIRLRLARPAPQGSALVVSENFYPGWTATVDGRPAEAARADYVLIGVPLTEGAREVTLRFRSAPYETGKTVTLVALGLAGALAIGGLAAERRRRG